MSYHSTLRIGFANTYFTLWSVSNPYKHYHNKYDWSWRVDSMYIRNLSMNEDLAVEKAKGFGATLLDINDCLRGSSSSFHTISDKVESDYPSFMYPRDLRHSYGQGDIRLLGINDNEVKALWFLYMKKDIVFIGENSCNSSWKRPIVHARRRMLDLGILVRYDGKVLSSSYLSTYKSIQAESKLKESLDNGHHFIDGARLELHLRTISFRTFPGEWGSFNVITYESKCGKLFSYMGSSEPNVSNELFTIVKATISHSNYKEQDITKLKRITVSKKK